VINAQEFFKHGLPYPPPKKCATSGNPGGDIMRIGNQICNNILENRLFEIMNKNDQYI